MANKADFFRDLYDEGNESEVTSDGTEVVKQKQRRPYVAPWACDGLDITSGKLKECMGHHCGSFASTHQRSARSEASPGSRDDPDTEDQRYIATEKPEKHLTLSVSISRSAESLNMPKRKRGPVLAEVPEGERIFQGQKFYFLPDNDIGQGRKLRIQKAQQFGAEWVRQWRSDITHVVVDNGINYQDTLKYLKLQNLPKDVLLVKQDYPGHCIMYKHLVNPQQPQYRVPGYETKLPPESVMSATEKTASFQVSLELKPEKQATIQTPSRTEDSDEFAASRELRLRVDQQESSHGREQAPFVGAFQEAISEARSLECLPLDDSEHDCDISDNANDSDDQGQLTEKKSKKPRLIVEAESAHKDWQDNFNCMHKNDGMHGIENENLNADTIEVLQKMYNYYERMQDHWRTLAYRRAIAALQKHSHRVTSKEEALAIPYIGDRLAQKIEEIAWTGRLRRLENTTLEPCDLALQTFLKIYGVGYKQASALVAQGFRTLEELTSKAHLTKNQQIGIEHFEDFQCRIPREEITKHGSYIRKMLPIVSPFLEAQIGGSYRRGASDSGDIDFIITAKDMPMDELRAHILDDLIPRLFASNYLKCALAVTSSDMGSKWHGACCLPGKSPPTWRRIDFLLVPAEEYGAALIYFTGNDIFNRSIRLLANKKGMRLNQRGLWKDVIRGQRRERVNSGTLVEAKSERAIFNALRVPWRPPEHRNC